ncbi:unnamed protein product [Paramecium pentaurelia]|uniref:Transmembrane protein n=1 Tax=Paramecium pentaurelia TaxID=43138 RepID=A0A8S1URB7_9CILI|nr:unnamed protein product [Paramecium pentaurelia]
MVRLSQSNHSFVVFTLFALLISSCNAINHLRGHIEEHQNKHLYSSHSKGNPITAVIIGFLCVFGAFAMLWYNERRQAITEYRLEQAKKQCTSVNSAEVNPNTNHQLVHTNGESKTQDLVVDAAFGLSMKDCIKLVRTVEMYQWVRKSREENKRTVYYYVQEWSSTFHSDCGDGHYNDKSKWIVEQETQVNLNVRIGAYLISKSLAEQTNANESIPMAMNNAQAVSNFYGYSKGFQNFEANGQYIYFQQNRGTVTMNDLRVSFDAARTGPTTVVSQQYNDTFTPFVIHDKFEQTLARDENLEDMELSCATCCCICCKLCRALEKPLTQIDWIFESIMTQNQVFKKKAEENACITLAQRIGGYVLMGIGFCLIFSPISWLVSLIPLLGNFLASITGFVFFLVSFIISIPFSLLTIAFAWLFYHPKYGIALIALSGLIGAGIYFYIKSQS